MKQRNTIKFVGIFFENKLTFRDNINRIEKMLKTNIPTIRIDETNMETETGGNENYIYKRNFAPDVLRNPGFEKRVENALIKTKLIRNQRIKKFKVDKRISHGVERGIMHN